MRDMVFRKHKNSVDPLVQVLEAAIVHHELFGLLRRITSFWTNTNNIGESASIVTEQWRRNDSVIPLRRSIIAHDKHATVLVGRRVGVVQSVLAPRQRLLCDRSPKSKLR